jgi:hypothetical protein
VAYYAGQPESPEPVIRGKKDFVRLESSNGQKGFRLFGRGWHLDWFHHFLSILSGLPFPRVHTGINLI